MYALPFVRFADPSRTIVGFLPVESPLNRRQFDSAILSAEADADEMLVDYIVDTALSVI
jgi:hypothetical protein